MYEPPIYTPTSSVGAWYYEEMSYLPPDYEPPYAGWFTMTLREMQAQRAKDGYVHDFDMQQHSAWFTATFQKLLDESSRAGYVYKLG